MSQPTNQPTNQLTNQQDIIRHEFQFRFIFFTLCKKMSHVKQGRGLEDTISRSGQTVCIL